MSKLRQKGAKSSLGGLATKASEPSEQKTKKTRLTTANQRAETTYKVSPLTMRLSARDKQAVTEWARELDVQTHRSVSPAKLLRALLALKDTIPEEELLKLINDM
ncbi:hypothetical protein [Vibrio diabolicus]|uniref:hypothetical protein n=1 Tax=Vibrio diabolicus TaxID=50719 RepID=UPI003752DF96